MEAIVSIEGGPGETAATPGFKKWIKFAPAARMLNGRRMVLGLMYRDMKDAAADETWVDEHALRGYAAGLVTDFNATLAGYQTMAKSEEPEMLRDHLGDIDVPVVLLLGAVRHKSGPPEDEVAILQALLTNFAIDTVAGTGYFIQEERPDAVTATIRHLVAPKMSVGKSR